MSESLLWLLRDVRRARKQGVAGMLWRQRRRLADLVASARGTSAFYRELYRHLPQRVEDPTLLPVTAKKTLMARFDDWVKDREVTSEQVRRFADDPGCIGQRLLGRHLVATSSGVTGDRGIFLIDERNERVSTALLARMMGDWLTAGDITRIIIRGGRMALVIATGGHFAGFVGATQLRDGGRLGSRLVAVFSVHSLRPAPTPTTYGRRCTPR
ncbi:hypothetical protein ABT214_12445 [Micromonospora purpureochromogenes]|uniref:hypothetical protein n=1 Tax=Micromonospora purpureochromogenes TaxID=47872 RepID=UPI00331699BC